MADSIPCPHDCRHLRLPAGLAHPRHWGTWLGVALISIIALAPGSVRVRVGGWLGRALYRARAKRRDIARVNLALCFPQLTPAEREAMLQDHFRMLGLGLLSYPLLWFGSERRLAAASRLIGEEHLVGARAQGRNVILVTGHTAVLDFGPMALGLKGYPTVGPYKAVNNPVIDWLLARGRCRFGKQLYERGRGMSGWVRGLKRGDVLIYLPDEDLGPEQAVFAPFFGVSKATLQTVARLAQLTRAAVIPCMSFYDRETGCYETRLLAPVAPFPTDDPVRDATLQNGALEDLIRRHPEQYLWAFKLFKTRPEGERDPYQVSEWAPACVRQP